MSSTTQPNPASASRDALLVDVDDGHRAGRRRRVERPLKHVEGLEAEHVEQARIAIAEGDERHGQYPEDQAAA
jgi:hypothetical protein